MQHLFRWVARRQVFLSIAKRLFKAHKLILCIFQLISIGLYLLTNPDLLLLLFPQFTGGKQHGAHLRFVAMLRLHWVNLARELLLLLLKFIQLFLQVSRVLDKYNRTREVYSILSYSSWVIWNSAWSYFICSFSFFSSGSPANASGISRGTKNLAR